MWHPKISDVQDRQPQARLKSRARSRVSLAVAENCFGKFDSCLEKCAASIASDHQGKAVRHRAGHEVCCTPFIPSVSL